MLAELIALWALGSAGGEADRTIVIGSKNFSESHLLGELMAQLVRAETDFEVEHKSGLGGTPYCWEGLVTGKIDLYPEYTGTAWSVVLKEPGTSSDPLRTFLTVQARCRERFDVEWLAPLGFNNTYALAVARERAEELGIRRISDLVPHAGSIRAGFSIEFMNRADGWAGLQPHYGLEFAAVNAMEHSLAYEALASGAIDLTDAYSTDGKLVRYDLVVLEDDRGFFPPYHAAPVVRGAVVREQPEVARALERLAFRLTDERMTALNHAVEVEGRTFADVAAAFLAAEGLVGDEGRSARSDANPAGFARFFAARWRETLRLGLEHIGLTLAAVFLAALVAIPLGVAVARAPLAARLALGGAGVIQTIPSLALLAFLIAIPGLGLTARSAIVALFLYALLPILRNTATGLGGVDARLVDAARGLGLTERQILIRIQLPLATRTILAGLRTATVISIGVATLAAFIGAGGLGEPIVTGLYLNDTRLILSGALPAAGLALVADHGLGRLERRLVPRGLVAGPS